MILDSGILFRLCQQYQYSLENDDQQIIFAIRGSLPEAALYGNFKVVSIFKEHHEVRPVRLNYETARCTVGLWDRKENKIALFPGSTLPSRTYLYTHTSSQKTLNLLCPGKYELRRGTHPRQAEGYQRHDAFLMDKYAMVEIPEVRTLRKSVRFNWNNSQYKVRLAGDNLHAARTEPVFTDSVVNCTATLETRYSSSGCITILGNPSQYVKLGSGNDTWNCWQTFIELVDETYSNKTDYSFLLFTYTDLHNKGNKSIGKSIRYGSQSSEVEQMQRTLLAVKDGKTGLPYYAGEINGQFLGETAQAYLKFQEDFLSGKEEPEISFNNFLDQTKHFNSYLNRHYNVNKRS